MRYALAIIALCILSSDVFACRLFQRRRGNSCVQSVRASYHSSVSNSGRICGPDGCRLLP